MNRYIFLILGDECIEVTAKMLGHHIQSQLRAVPDILFYNRLFKDAVNASDFERLMRG
jgi:hypothetical protein